MNYVSMNRIECAQSVLADIGYHNKVVAVKQSGAFSVEVECIGGVRFIHGLLAAEILRCKEVKPYTKGQENVTLRYKRRPTNASQDTGAA